MNIKTVAGSMLNWQLGTAILNIKDALHNNHYKKYSAVVLSNCVLFSVAIATSGTSNVCPFVRGQVV